jgi:sporulation protein YlmC with PRC-barrel domain
MAMLRSVKSILGYRIEATDGGIGKIVDAYFNDAEWVIRYMVVDTGSWLSGRRVLLSPAAFVDPKTRHDWDKETIPVTLTKEQVQSAPDILSDKPISRQMEIDIAQYYRWPYYWTSDPALVSEKSYLFPGLNNREEKTGDTHLRSSNEVIGYYIKAADGDIGHVNDLIVDIDSWQINYFVVDTGNILPGKKVLISLQWIKDISWSKSKVEVELTCAKVKDSPAYDPDAPVNREMEEVIYDYYGRPKYWDKTK